MAKPGTMTRTNHTTATGAADGATNTIRIRNNSADPHRLTEIHRTDHSRLVRELVVQ